MPKTIPARGKQNQCEENKQEAYGYRWRRVLGAPAYTHVPQAMAKVYPKHIENKEVEGSHYRQCEGNSEDTASLTEVG